MGESNYMVYLETKKRYHSIFAKFHQELKLLESVVKTLSGKILIFKKILRNMGWSLLYTLWNIRFCQIQDVIGIQAMQVPW